MHKLIKSGESIYFQTFNIIVVKSFYGDSRSIVVVVLIDTTVSFHCGSPGGAGYATWTRGGWVYSLYWAIYVALVYAKEQTYYLVAIVQPGSQTLVPMLPDKEARGKTWNETSFHH